MTVKLYTLKNKLMKESRYVPNNFTGIAKHLENGWKGWYLNGTVHRTDGPATYYGKNDPNNAWWINGEQIICSSNEQFKLYVDLLKLKGLV